MGKRMRTAIVAAVLVAAAAWGYTAVYHVSVGVTAARQVARRWLGPTSQSVTGGLWSTTMVAYGGYLHRDWEIQELVCTPGPSACQASYSYTVFVNGQTSRVDHAMINTGPGVSGWPLTVTRHAAAHGGR